jgi:2'-5' RNA ligase
MARLFVAVTPPADVVEPLVAAVARGRAVAPGLRWVDPERIHLTLVFLGSVDDETRADLVERLARVARRHPPVAAALAAPGRFGDRVLWAGVAGELAPLAAGVRRAASRAGIEGLDTRPLRAHLTLARARDDHGAGGRAGATGHGERALGHQPAGARAARETAGLRPALAALGQLPEVAWTVDRIDLMSSVLGPRPRYTVEASWPLAGR